MLIDAALLQYSQVATLPKANIGNVNSLNLWLQEEFSVGGAGSTSWGYLRRIDPDQSLVYLFLRLIRSIFWAPNPKGNDLDLIVPFPRFKVDSLTRWVADEFYVFYQRLRAPIRRKERGPELPITSLNQGNAHIALKTYRSFGEPIVRVRSAVTTLIACLLATAAIAILSTIHKTGLLIGVIGIFTFLFAIGLMFFTSAKPTTVEIFSATAA